MHRILGQSVRRWVSSIMLVAVTAFVLNGAAVAQFEATSGPGVGVHVWHSHADADGSGYVHAHDVDPQGDHDHDGKLPCATPGVAALPAPFGMSATLSITSDLLFPAIHSVRPGTDVSGQKPPPRSTDIA